MGMGGFFFFGEADSVFVTEISKAHKAPREVVERYYKIMLDSIKHDLQK